MKTVVQKIVPIVHPTVRIFAEMTLTEAMAFNKFLSCLSQMEILDILGKREYDSEVDAVCDVTNSMHQSLDKEL